jgi:hypothetical protein
MPLITTNTFWTILLIIHGLAAIALLGALTHQAVSVALPARAPAGGFIARYRAVPSAGYATAVCVLWVFTFIIGAWIYTQYRVYVRIPLEEIGYWKTVGFFDFKEHMVTIGLGMLPIYWYLWKHPRTAEYDSARRWLTVVLALICWQVFLTGHILNNARGFGT